MKKIILSALMLMTMACSTAFAGMVGNAFSVEEDMALTVIRNMTGGQRNAVVAHFVSDMAEKYTEDAHKAGVAGLAKNSMAVFIREPMSSFFFMISIGNPRLIARYPSPW